MAMESFGSISSFYRGIIQQPSTPSVEPPAGYIWRWQFDNDVTDDVGTYNLSNQNVNFAGSPVYGVFNGTNAYANTSTITALNKANDHTMAIVLSLDNTWSVGMPMANTQGTTDRWWFYYDWANRISYGIYTGSWSRMWVTLSDTNFHIVIGTWDAGTSTANIYMDSSTAGALAGSVSTATNAWFRFWSRTDWSVFFDGNIQEAILYDRNMSDDTSEIDDLVTYSQTLYSTP